MLMGDYGWTPRPYERWLGRMILTTMIQPGHAAACDPHAHGVTRRSSASDREDGFVQ